jgi:hypothetical protein
MVQADQKDEASLTEAFQGAHAIFAVTDYYDFFFQIGKDASMEREFTYGTNLARAASKIETLQTYVWSTLPPTSVLTNNEAVVPHFDGKGRVNLYIKEHLPSLYEKTTFTLFTIFAVNMHQYPIFRPVWVVSSSSCTQKHDQPADQAMYRKAHRNGFNSTLPTPSPPILVSEIMPPIQASSFGPSWRDLRPVAHT